MIRYSQNREQDIILSYFRGQTGTFLDLGSYTGMELSNVRALAELGWKGVMVEASPTVFRKLKKNYRKLPKIELFNCCVATQTGIFEFLDNPNAVGTLHKHEAERWTGAQEFTKIDVQCLEVNELISMCKYQTFDFISCDIEGEDLNVIRRLDFDKLKTRMVCVEFNGQHKHVYSRILKPFRFKLIHQNGENLIYAK